MGYNINNQARHAYQRCAPRRVIFMVNKKYTKPTLTISQQMEFLVSQGLQIVDRELAYHALSTVSYYRFSSYLLPFKLPHQNSSPRQFKKNVTFAQVWQLYQFDRELRLLVADAIEKIEVAFRAALINVTSKHFHPFWYVERVYFKEHKARANALSSAKCNTCLKHRHLLE